jgi:hypothetical protein
LLPVGLYYCTLTFTLPYCCRNVRRWGAFLAKTIVFPIGFQWCRFLTFSTQPKGSSAKPSTSSRRGEKSDLEQRNVLRFGCAGCRVFRFVEYQPASERRLGKWSIFSFRVDMQYSGGAVSTCMSTTCPFIYFLIPKLETSKIQELLSAVVQSSLNCRSIPVESPSYSLTIKCCTRPIYKVANCHNSQKKYQFYQLE